MTKASLLTALKKLIKWISVAILSAVWLLLALWSAGVVYYSNLPAEWMRVSATCLFVVVVVAAFLFVRPWWRAHAVFVAAVTPVFIWFLLMPPSNDRDWRPDVAVLPYAEIHGHLVTIHNVRDCDYSSPTNYVLRHYDRTYDLDQLNSVDLFLNYWGSPAIAHPILSFGFTNGVHVCFSVEVRYARGQAYSTIKGLFRYFALTYVVADEHDVIRLRTNYRREQVYLYHLNVDPATTRLIFLDYLDMVNQLKIRPRWYNVLTANCTTEIHGHTYPYLKKKRWDWRILVNGYVDELAYEVGALDQSLPFKELKVRSLINERAQAANKDSDFSARIRQGLPGF